MKFLKRTCPKCGAKVDSVTGDNDELVSFKCGSDSPVHSAELSTQSDICKELCELRSNLTPEGAKPLVFMRRFSGGFFAPSSLGIFVMEPFSEGFALICSDKLRGVFEDFDAAKAHAEELHQKAFAEFVEKWGKK